MKHVIAFDWQNSGPLSAAMFRADKMASWSGISEIIPDENTEKETFKSPEGKKKKSNGSYCSAIGCTNNSKTFGKSLHYFPIKDKER